MGMFLARKIRDKKYIFRSSDIRKKTKSFDRKQKIIILFGFLFLNNVQGYRN